LSGVLILRDVDKQAEQHADDEVNKEHDEQKEEKSPAVRRESHHPVKNTKQYIAQTRIKN